MGSKFIDKYSYLHFASGIIANYWGISLIIWIIFHLVFEILENTKIGMYIINKVIRAWPGGKEKSDTFINSMLGDNLFAIIGWLSAYALN